MTVPTVLPAGKGDITNPYAWADATATFSNGVSQGVVLNTPYVIPPTAYDNLTIEGATSAVGYPNNGDGRYWWEGNYDSAPGAAIAFVGDPLYVSASAGVLVWQIMQRAGDGSQPQIQYSLNGGATFTDVNIGSEGEPQEGQNWSGTINMTLSSTTTGLVVNVISSGGSSISTAAKWIVAVAVVRNQYAVVPYDPFNGFDPISYNAEYGDLPAESTLLTLRTQMMYRLGFANQASNPPPGMANLLTQFLQDSQNVLYRRYPALHMRRFFRWKIVPGIRFYSLKDNDENVLSNYHLDPKKTIEWAGIQDTRNVWYPVIQGIPPQLYTMITKPWRPARYEIRQAIEVYPAPDQTYWLWVKGHFGLLSFSADSDVTTIDSTLVYLHALANAKAHYGQPDANNVMAEANTILAELIAGTHGTRKYVPGTMPVPPAVRPTLINYQDNQQA